MARRTNLQDAVRAYTWYLVGLKRAAETKEFLAKLLLHGKLKKRSEKRLPNFYYGKRTPAAFR